MLELYQYEECPDCAEVRKVLTDLRLDYIIRNEPRDRAERRRAQQIAGDDGAVPILVDTTRGVILVERLDIITYLRDVYGTQEERFADIQARFSVEEDITQ